MHELIAIADSTEINALVIDMKDEFGLNFESADTTGEAQRGELGEGAASEGAARHAEGASHSADRAPRDVQGFGGGAQQSGALIRKPDGTPWHDKKGLTWVDPYDHAIWEYNIGVAEEMAKMGFGEVQFDYIRFPEPYKSLPEQVFPDANGVTKPHALGEFFKTACPRVHAAGARCTADIFGLVTTVPGALEIGQQWEELAPRSDVLLPMVYPSHYPHGSFGIDQPNAEPYKVIYAAIHRAHERDLKIGVDSRRITCAHGCRRSRSRG